MLNISFLFSCALGYRMPAPWRKREFDPIVVSVGVQAAREDEGQKAGHRDGRRIECRVGRWIERRIQQPSPPPPPRISLFFYSKNSRCFLISWKFSPVPRKMFSIVFMSFNQIHTICFYTSKPNERWCRILLEKKGHFPPPVIPFLC